MNKKLRVLLLAGNTLRARAYAQYLSKFNTNIEVEGLFYGFNEKQCNVPELNSETKKYLKNNNLFIPDFSESLLSTFQKNNWNYLGVENSDVNSEEILRNIKVFNSDVVVFSGYGGQLLKQLHFSSPNWKYLHMHPGKLPLERGSTTLYYSILNQRNCTVTAFYMTEKIDAGKSVLFCEYVVPNKEVNIDQWLDNIIRADCFIKAINSIAKKEEGINNTQDSSEEYYVIHPVLKHIALLSLK